MSVITKMLRQRAVYWAPTGRGPNGGITYALPVEVRARWEDVQEDVLGKDQETRVSKATVYVGQDVEVGGMLKLGSLVSSTPADPADATDAFEIFVFEALPNFKATEFLRTARVG